VFIPVKYRIVSDKKLNRKNTRTRAHLKANDRIGHSHVGSRELQNHFPTKGVQQHGISTDCGREINRRGIVEHAVFLRGGWPQARPTALSVRPTPNNVPFPTTSPMWLPILTDCTCSTGESLSNKRRNEKGGGDVGVSWSMQ
jgi:hypothetical protein